MTLHKQTPFFFFLTCLCVRERVCVRACVIYTVRSLEMEMSDSLVP